MMNILKMCACVSMVCACAFGASERVNRVYDRAADRVGKICEEMQDMEWYEKLDEMIKRCGEDVKPNSKTDGS